jgi:hypothetical protein
MSRVIRNPDSPSRGTSFRSEDRGYQKGIVLHENFGSIVASLSELYIENLIAEARRHAANRSVSLGWLHPGLTDIVPSGSPGPLAYFGWIWAEDDRHLTTTLSPHLRHGYCYRAGAFIGDPFDPRFVYEALREFAKDAVEWHPDELLLCLGPGPIRDLISAAGQGEWGKTEEVLGLLGAHLDPLALALLEDGVSLLRDDSHFHGRDRT